MEGNGEDSEIEVSLPEAKIYGDRLIATLSPLSPEDQLDIYGASPEEQMRIRAERLDHHLRGLCSRERGYIKSQADTPFASACAMANCYGGDYREYMGMVGNFYKEILELQNGFDAAQESIIEGCNIEGWMDSRNSNSIFFDPDRVMDGLTTPLVSKE
ncbi:hypothetical protein KKA94_03785 [Patescibacteria group bacterium]|nr:hypothetical protein [Patescibacteria group bacterium]